MIDFPQARLITYPCVEHYGMIMVWYHPSNEPAEYDAICIDEFTENAADIQHFISFAEEPWKIYFYNTAILKIFGKKYESTKVSASIIFHGLGSTTLIRFDGNFGRLYLFHTNTPSEYTKLNVVFRVFAERKIPRF
jgi:hypothetical protein